MNHDDSDPRDAGKQLPNSLKLRRRHSQVTSQTSESDAQPAPAQSPKWRGFREAGIDATRLDARQRDGLACVVCAGDRGPMVPATVLNGCQTFVHVGCVSGFREAGRSVQAVIDDVLCDACSPQYRQAPTRGVRIGVAGDGQVGLVLCAYHGGELLARLLACRGRF